MNIDKRAKILSKSLEIENGLSNVIKEIIKIPKSETKTLGNQSSSLAFKTKADLLYDLERITKEEYKLLILFMEIRNQFIHNIHADSFIKVFEILGNNKKNKLLKINNEVAEIQNIIKNEEDIEKNLEFGFNFLSLSLNQTLINIREQIIEDFKAEQEKEAFQKINEFYLEGINIFQDTVEEFGEVFEKELTKADINIDFKEIMTSFIHQKSIEKIQEKYPDFKF